MRKRYGDIVKGMLFVFVLVLLFYRDIIWMMALGIPMGVLVWRELRLQWRREDKWQLNLEFKEGLQGIAAALNAGYSIENALEESRKDLIVLYGEDSALVREFQIIIGQLQLNRPLEEALDDFAERCEVEDVHSFSEVFRTARRSGGDLVSITRMSAQRIGEKIEVDREIHTMIAGRQMEGRIMNIVPLGMIFYFWVCSPGFLDGFYETLRGHLIMTAMLFAYLGAGLLSRRICRITV